jgi:hypothetical protein
VQRVLVAAALGLMLFGCHTPGHVRRSEVPELASIRLAAGRKGPVPENFGMVHAIASGFGRCDTIAARALRDLLAEARARGANRVQDVRFRARVHWTGRAMCRRYFPLLPGLYSSEVEGLAVAAR